MSMRNRAQCKLCGDTIESFTDLDYITCSCGEISLYGGTRNYFSAAKDYKNFLRVHEDGIPHEIKFIEEDLSEKNEVIQPLPENKPPLDYLKGMIDSFEHLPQSAINQPITHYDLQAALLVIYAILKEKG